MVIKAVYNQDTLTDEVWYDSSMIKYSKMVESPTENIGTLSIMFNNGTTYIYEDVLISDYVLVKAGGTDSSNGKALNKIIRGKYKYSKDLSAPTLTEIQDKLANLLLEEQKASVENTEEGPTDVFSE